MSDILDRAQENEERDRTIALHNVLMNRSDVEIVEDFRNGHVVRICAECGIDIPLKRIKALPLVALCIECQSAKER